MSQVTQNNDRTPGKDRSGSRSSLGDACSTSGEENAVPSQKAHHSVTTYGDDDLQYHGGDDATHDTFIDIDTL